MLRFLLILFLSFNHVCLFGQVSTLSNVDASGKSLIKGKVCDTLGNPVEFAQIYICNEGKVKAHEVTNEFGLFNLLFSFEENDILVIQSEGFSLHARLLDKKLLLSKENYFSLTPMYKILYFDDQNGH